MRQDPGDDLVARQYQRWRYPRPIADLAAWSRDHWEWFDPRYAHRLLWPERGYRDDLDILIAGCGTNQAAVFAWSNPGARVLAVDVSQASLDHQQQLKDRHGLRNLELQRLPIERLAGLGRDFDLIVSTGVLHHLAQPRAGMQALLRCLRPDGVMGVMLYARYGRIGVDMLQSAFAELGLGQDQASLAVVRGAIAMLPTDHPLRGYLDRARDLGSDAGMVDTFLHGRQRSYSVPDCIELVQSAGAVFQGWLLQAPYYAHDLLTPDGAFLDAVDALPEARQWALMERIHSRNACHFFMACHPHRPPASYRIDFASDDCLDYVPMLRMRCGFDEGGIVRPGWRLDLNPAQRALLRHLDDQRSIRAIAARAAKSDDAPRNDKAELEAFARKLLRALWRLDFLAMGLPGDAHQPAATPREAPTGSGPA